MKHLSSVQNSIVKQFILLQSKSKIRKENGLFVVEGRRELLLADGGLYAIKTIYWCPEIFEESQFRQWQNQMAQSPEVVSVSLPVYQKMVVRDSTEGIVGEVVQKENTLNLWNPTKKNLLLLVIESIEKPGNLGAILRTADAAAVDAVIITEQHTDIHNPNVIRSSVGAFFSVPIYVSSNEETWQFLNKHNIKPFAASLQKSVYHYKENFTLSTAFILGSEASGLSPFWYKDGVTAIKIPMLGSVDSLNVSVAAAVLTFEALRQRNS